MKKQKLNFGMSIMIGALMFFCFSCRNSTSEKKTEKEKDNYEIVYQKKFGMTDIIMCFVSDTNDATLKDIGSNIIGNSKIAFVFFYTDKSKIKDINQSSDALDAMPSDGYVAEYSTENGFKKNINTYIVEKPKGPIKIIFLEQKTRKSKYRWYTYYVENYTDTKETDNKMIKIAEKAKYSDDGFTEIFFFNNKHNAPKLASDGGWGDNESQNSWNEKYGKYCVGYYSVGGGYSGEFSKGWK